MLLLKNLQIPIQKEPDYLYWINRKLGLATNSILHFKPLMRSIDARHKNHIFYNYTFELELSGKVPSHSDLLPYVEEKQETLLPIGVCDASPFIIGTGPAGLFCALAMVENGLKPYLFDRGESLLERNQKVSQFWETGLLDPESNVQFGEGGAGTFSDGKLTARSRHFYARRIYEMLVQFGADEDICMDALPHLGTDVLKKILTEIRSYLESKGCRFFWRHKLQSVTTENGKVTQVRINDVSYCPEMLILAIGNAARDTFHMLNVSQIAMEAKPLAVGFRLEHTQEFINERFYGRNVDLSVTGPATYRLTAKSGRRGVYSFCMCPGGEVIAAASEPGMQVTNGMSEHQRNGRFANSAIVVSVDQEDFGQGALAGVQFQRHLEQAAFRDGYAAPVQRSVDFMKNKHTGLTISTSYRPAHINENLNLLLPPDIILALKHGLNTFSQRIDGFIEQGILIAPETRTSSPVRLLRDAQNGHARGISNLFPVGEGSGYAGGIISSAVDGYKLGLRFTR